MDTEVLVDGSASIAHDPRPAVRRVTRTRLAVGLIAALASPGCGTILVGRPTEPFSGSAFDLGCIISGGSQRFIGVLLVPFGIADLPLSFAADLALLPIVGLAELVGVVEIRGPSPPHTSPAPLPPDLPLEVPPERATLVVLGEIADGPAPANAAMWHRRRCYTEMHRQLMRRTVGRWLRETVERVVLHREQVRFNAVRVVRVAIEPLEVGPRLVADRCGTVACATLDGDDERKRLWAFARELEALPDDVAGCAWPAVEGDLSTIEEVVYLVLLPDALAFDRAVAGVFGAWPRSAKVTIVPLPMDRMWSAAAEASLRAAGARRGVEVRFLDGTVAAPTRDAVGS